MKNTLMCLLVLGLSSSIAQQAWAVVPPSTSLEIVTPYSLDAVYVGMILGLTLLTVGLIELFGKFQ